MGFIAAIITLVFFLILPQQSCTTVHAINMVLDISLLQPLHCNALAFKQCIAMESNYLTVSVNYSCIHIDFVLMIQFQNQLNAVSGV